MEEIAKKNYFSPAFDGVARLYGKEAGERLRCARVLMVGLGGVGSWVAEAMGRSGVGYLGLVDGDDVCLTNVNRQLPALPETVGKMKAVVVADRLRRIHPEVEVEVHETFLTASNMESLLPPGRWDVVVDAIDRAKTKALLAAHCRAIQTPLIMVGAAGGRMDPTRVTVTDLCATRGDALLAPVRKILRRQHGFSREKGRPLEIQAVWSAEAPVLPTGDGGVCPAVEAGSGQSRRLGCETGFGSSAMVTGAFGLVAAAEAVKLLTAS